MIDVSDEERELGIKIYQKINEDRVYEGKTKLMYCKNLEQVIYSAVRKIDINEFFLAKYDKEFFFHDQDMTPFLDYDSSYDIVSNENPDSDWAQLIHDRLERDNYLGDWDLGMVAVNQLDPESYSFISLFGHLTDNAINLCE